MARLWMVVLGCGARWADDPIPAARVADPFADGDPALPVLATWTLTVVCQVGHEPPPALDIRLSADACGLDRLGDGLRLRDGQTGGYHLDAGNTPGFDELAACVAGAPDGVQLDLWTLVGDGGCGRGLQVPPGLPRPVELQLRVDRVTIPADGAPAEAELTLELRGST